MTGIGAVIVAAGVDPWERAAEVTAAEPAAVAGLARQYQAAADQAGVAVQAARRADVTTAQNYVVDGVPVHDAPGATAATTRALGNGGEHAATVARALTAVSAALGRAKGGVGAELTALGQELRALDAQARGPLPPLQATARERSFDRAVATVRSRGARVSALLDEYDTALVAQTHVLDGLGYAPQQVDVTAGGVPPPPAGGGPADDHRWWQSLTDDQRQQVLAHDPALVGNLDGVPAEVRDAANRARLPAEATRIDTELADTRQQLDAALHRTGFALNGPQPTALQARLEGLQEQRAALDSVVRTTAVGDHQLLLLDLNGHDLPRAAVATGDVDTAKNVVVFTPGTTATVSRGLEGYVGNAEGIRQVGQQELARSGRPDEQVAAVTWIGYDTPQLDGTIADPSKSVTRPDAAQRGGVDLAGFLDGINASRPHDDPHLTAIGHSYGSVTTGYALQHTTTPVDDVVVFGSPGLGTDDVRNLHVAPGHLFEIEARDDPIADLGSFGPDPNHLDGVSRLSAHAETVDGVPLKESTVHFQYLTPNTTSQYNIAVTAAGLPDLQVAGSGDAGIGDVLRRGVPVP